MKTGLVEIFCLSLVVGASVPALGQVVTVSKSGAADETAIQVAIDSLAPGGSRDDGDRTNNVVRILDDVVYNEALSVTDMGLTLEGSGPTRPRIVTSFTDAAVNSSNFAVRVDSDTLVSFRNLIFLPDAAEPPTGCMTLDEYTNSGTNTYSAVFEDVLIAANDGADNPSSMDGFAAPDPGAVRYLENVVDLNSNPAAATPSISFLRTVITGCSGPGDELLRIFTDNATVNFGEGCAFTWSDDHGVRLFNALDTVAHWQGTAANPIVFHGNGGSAISSSDASTRAVATMQYVAITRNGTDNDSSAIDDLYAGTPANEWTNVTIAGNSAKEGADPSDGPFDVATALTLVNCIIAGDGGEAIVGERNLPFVDNGAVLTAEGVCIDTSHGPTTLNTLWQMENGDPVDGIEGADPVPVGAGILNASPDFISLEPSSPDYLRVTNEAFAEAGPLGVALVGAGRFEELPFAGMTETNASLQSYMNGYSIPSSGSSNKYNQPNDDELMIFKSAMLHTLDGNLQAASNLLDLVNYDLNVWEDSDSDDFFAVLEEKASNRNWRGLFAVDLSPERLLVTESPHALFDGTKLEAIDIFLQTGSFAFMQTGTHRNNSPDVTPCSGTQSSGDPYYISDMAHTTQSFFQGMHDTIRNSFPDAIAVSVHGMAASSDPSDVALSNGTGTQTNGPSLSRDLAVRMNEILSDAGDTRYAVSHQEPGENPALSGGTNTQGRYTNGAADACTSSIAAINPERFIHMEQSPTVRSGPAAWAFVIETYNDLIGEFPADAPDAPEDGSLVAEFPLNGGLASTTGQKGGLAQGALTAAANRFNTPGQALAFADSGYATIPDFRYDGPDTEYSLLFWFRTKNVGSTGFQYLFSHGSIGRDGEFTLPDSLHVYLGREDGGLRIRYSLGDGLQYSYNGPTGLADETWHLFSLTYSQTLGTTIFVDGQSVVNEPGHLLRTFDPEGPIYLGARSDLGENRFFGQYPTDESALDNLRIYNSALLPAEILAIFNEPDSGGVPGWAVF